MVSQGRFSTFSSSASFSLSSWIGLLFVEIWLWIPGESFCAILLSTLSQHSLNSCFWRTKVWEFRLTGKYLLNISSCMEVTNRRFFWLPCHQRGCQPASLRAQMLTNQPIQAPGQSLWNFVTWQKKSHFNQQVGWGTWLGHHLVGRSTLVLLSLGFRRRAGSEACSWIDISLMLQNKKKE